MKTAFISSSPANVARVYGEGETARLAAHSDLLPGVFSKDDALAGRLADVEALFSTWGMPVFTEAEIASRLPKLKALFYAAGATDAFVRPFLARGVAVMSAWRSNAVPVAEFCQAQILLALKGYFRNVREGRAACGRAVSGPGIFGERVALIGDGAVAHCLMDRLATSRIETVMIPSRPFERTVSLEEAFKTAYVVSNHLPDRDDNIACIGRVHFESMREGATFINTGRGRQIDEKALIDVFSARPDLTALLDVTYPEPPAKDSPLWTLPNVLVTAHIAGSLGDEVRRMAVSAVDDFIAFSETGLTGPNFVREEMLITSGQ